MFDSIVRNRRAAAVCLAVLGAGCFRFDVAPRSNAAPRAKAAEVLTASVGERVVLDGRESTDEDGDTTLAFRWSQAGDAGEPVTLDEAETPVASFVAPGTPQRLFFRLIVSDGAADSAPAVVRVDVVMPGNAPPVARAADAELEAFTAATVVLDGSGSTDPDGDPLAYRWSQVGDGADPVSLTDARKAVATFVAPAREQRLFFQLVVNDGRADSAPVVVQVDVSARPNGAPVASVAQAELTVGTGASVVLDGSGSTDPDGDALTYRWEQVATIGEPVALEDAREAVAGFVAPDRGQRLFFRLTVSDGLAESSPVVVRVVVNSAPIATPGAPLRVPNGTSVLVEGDGVDLDGDRIAGFRWRVVSAPAGGASCVADASPCLFGAGGAAVSFTPPAKGDYVLSLEVTDGALWSAPANVLVLATNRPPRATPAASSLSVPNATTVTLDAGGSEDPDGDAVVAWRWGVASLPPNATATFDPASADVQTPALRLVGKGSYFVSLVTIDAEGAESAPATLRLEVTNGAPRAEVPADVVVTTGEPVELLGRGLDPDGDALTYAWALVDFPQGGRVTLTGADERGVRLTPSRRTAVSEPALCEAGGCYVLSLVVSDGLASSAPALVRIASLNRPPVAAAGPDLVNPPLPVVLDGSGSSDPDGDVLRTFRWEQKGGLDVTAGTDFLSGQTVTFEPPEAGTYVFDLVVSDGVASSAADRVVVQVGKANEPPIVALARTQVLVEEGATAAGLDASATLDRDGDEPTIVWTRTSGSPLFPATLVGARPQLTAPRFRQLLEFGQTHATYDVTASDGRLTSQAQPVSIHVTPGASDFVVVSNVASADDGASPACGTVATPCASLSRALALVDPDGDGIGDGRDVVLTSGQYQVPADAAPLEWPGGTRLWGGRDARLFSAEARSEVRLDVDCRSPHGLELGPRALGVVLERTSFSMAHQGCLFMETPTILCDGCDATLREVKASIDSGNHRTVALRVKGATGKVRFLRSHAIAGRGGQMSIGVWASGGSQVVVEDSRLDVTVPSQDQHSALRVEQARAEVRRSVLWVQGSAPLSGTISGLYSEGGVLLVESSAVVNSAAPNGPVVFHTSGGSAAIHYSTLLGSGATAGNGVGLATTEPVAFMGNLVADSATALRLTGNGSRSLVFGNALAPSGAYFATCGPVALTSIDGVNAAAGGPCNSSGAAWTGNLAERCPLRSPATGDFRLNTGVANACVDSGPAASPAGTAPPFDLEGGVRPGTGGGRPDIGADEAK